MKAVGGAAAGVDLLVLGDDRAGLEAYRWKAGGEGAGGVYVGGGGFVVQETACRQEEGACANATDGCALASLCAKEADEGGVVADGLLHILIFESRDEEQVEPGRGVQRLGLVFPVYIGMTPVVDDGDIEKRTAAFFFIEPIYCLEYIQYGRHAQEAVILRQ